MFFCVFEFWRKMFLQEKMGTLRFYLSRTVDLLFDMESQVVQCFTWFINVYPASQAGNGEEQREKDAEKISLSFSLPTPALPRRQLTSKS